MEQDGKAVVGMYAGALNKCYQGALDAEVTRTEETIVITIPPRLLGCDAIRFIIKNDGTGGKREMKSRDRWIWDRFDRDLTIRKQVTGASAAESTQARAPQRVPTYFNPSTSNISNSPDFLSARNRAARNAPSA